jgi:hypothetical protein
VAVSTRRAARACRYPSRDAAQGSAAGESYVHLAPQGEIATAAMKRRHS